MRRPPPRHGGLYSSPRDAGGDITKTGLRAQEREMSDPVQMRRALEVARAYKENGILFVPMPVFSDEECRLRAHEAASRLEEEARKSEEPT